MAFDHSRNEPATATGGELGGAGSGGSDGPTLKERIWFTLGLLIVYRLGTYVPIPGVDPSELAGMFPPPGQGLFGTYFYLFPSALWRASIFALNVLPYLVAVILVQVLATVSPWLKTLGRQGAAGHWRIRQYILFATVLLCVIQSYGLSVGLENIRAWRGSVVYDPGPVFRLTTVVTLTAGTMLLVWLAEQITQRGIGNGIALIIFAGIVTNLPLALGSTLELGRTGGLSGTVIVSLLVMALAVMVFVVFMENAKRKVLVAYSKGPSGIRKFDGDTSHLALKPNVAGIAPPIFASSLLVVPLTIDKFPGGSARGEWLGEMTQIVALGWPVYWVIYAGLIVFFAFLCAKTLFNPTDLASSLKERGGFIPGIRPGKNTADHLNFIQTRLYVIGAVYLALVCVIPDFVTSYLAIPFHIAGTSLFVVVSVAVEIMRRIRAELSASAS